MSDRFTTEEKSLYSALMAARYASEEQFPVDFTEFAPRLGYTRMENAHKKLLGEYTEGTDFCLLHASMKKSGRGRPAAEYFLTVEAAEEFALSTGTAEGKKIRRFFVRALHVLQDYHFLTVLNEQRRSLHAARHQALLEAYRGRNVVYVAVIHDLVDGWVVKVGWTNNLGDRTDEHIRNYGKHIYLVYVFEAVKNHELETRLFSKPVFKQNVYNEPVNGKISHEHFRVQRQGGFDMKKLTEVIRREGQEFKQYEKEIYLRQQEVNNDAKRLELQEQQLRLDRERFEFEKGGDGTRKEGDDTQSVGDMTAVLPGDLQKAFQEVELANNGLRQLLARAGVTAPDEAEAVAISETTENQEGTSSAGPSVKVPRRLVQTQNSMNGPFVQMLDRDTFDIVRTFQGQTDAVREYSRTKTPGEPDISIAGLNGAVDNSSVYHGFRWFFVDRDKDPLAKYDIPPTNEDIRLVSPGWIAQLNWHKTEIISVFPDQKSAGEANGFRARGSVCLSIKNGAAAGKNHFDLWDSCAQELKDAYVAKNGVPHFAPRTVIDAYDCDGKLLASYATKQEIVNQLAIGHVKLSKILESGELYRDRVFKWTQPPKPRKKKGEPKAHDGTEVEVDEADSTLSA